MQNFSLKLIVINRILIIIYNQFQRQILYDKQVLSSPPPPTDFVHKPHKQVCGHVCSNSDNAYIIWNLGKYLLINSNLKLFHFCFK